MKPILQAVERLCWVFLLAAGGQLLGNGVADAVGIDWSMPAAQVAFMSGSTAALREFMAFAQARLAFLPAPGNVPVPINDAIRNGSGD